MTPEEPRGPLARAAEATALVGGLGLLAAALVTLASVLGNAAGRPMLGDTEIVELLMGAAVACFMPWATLRGANIVIGVFTDPLPRRVRSILEAAGALVFALVVSVLTWRLIQGGLDMHERERETMFLRLPFWWGYAGAGMGCLLWAAVAWARVLDRLRRTGVGR